MKLLLRITALVKLIRNSECFATTPKLYNVSVQ